jgi:hypothetical protein
MVEPSPEQNEDSHEQLMRLFREYFRANQDWINKGTRTAGMEVRRLLAEIRIVARERRAHVQQWRHYVDQQKAQKKGKGGASTTN